MQGVILRAGRDWSLTLGDDCTRYTFAPEEWRSVTIEPSGAITFRMELDRCSDREPTAQIWASSD